MKGDRKRLLAPMALAILILAMCAGTIGMIGDDSEAIDRGTASAPLSSLSMDALSIAETVPLEVYVKIGGSVSIKGFFEEEDGIGRSRIIPQSVTNGFGLKISSYTISEYDVKQVTGTLTRTGDCTITFRNIDEDLGQISDADYTSTMIIHSVTDPSATKPVTDISISGTRSMVQGSTSTFKANVSPSNATNKTVTWSSSNSAVASVDSSGLVTARTAGTATIKATANDGSGVSGTYEVEVSNLSISFTTSTESGVTGKQYKYIVSYNAGTVSWTIPSTCESVKWGDDNYGVTFPSTGKYTIKAAVTNGTVTRTATVSVTISEKTYEYQIWYMIDSKLGKLDEYETAETSHTFIVDYTPEEPENKIFEGWAESPKESVKYYIGDEITLTSAKDYLDLYAIFTTIPATTLTFDANGGTNAPKAMSVYEKGATHSWTIPTDDPEWEHHTFRGWSRNQAGTEVQYKSGSTYEFDARVETIIYALWDCETAHLYLKDGDELIDGTVTADWGTEAQIPAITLKKDGYAHIGWSATEGSTTAELHAGDRITLDSDPKIIYAVWAKNIVNYVLAFDANGGTDAPDSLSLKTEADSHDFTIPTATPTYNDFPFLGWSTARNSTTAEYKAGDTFTLTRDSPTDILYAVWQAPVAYTLTFDANGGTGAPEAVTAKSATGSADVTVPTATPTGTKDDAGFHTQVFKCWSYDKNGTKTVSPGSKITLTKDTTLYAIWYDFWTYSYGFSDNLDGSTVYEGDTTKTVQNNPYVWTISKYKTASRDGYNFKGWAETPYATEAKYQPGDTVTQSTQLLILYAVWKPVTTFTLSFSANGGTGAPEPVTQVSETSVCIINIPTTVPTNSNLRFLGWSETPTGTATVQRGAAYSMPSISATLYAIWGEPEPTTFTLTYDANGGTGAPGTQEKALTGVSWETTVSKVKPEWNGHVFAGWSYRSDATVEDYVGGDTIILTSADTKLYAVWKTLITYTLTFDANGGTNAPKAMSDTTADLSCELTIPTTEPTWSGHVFAGWSYRNNATEVDYVKGEKIILTSADTKLYAVWKTLITYTLTFDANGGSGAPATVTGTSVSDECELTIPSGTPSLADHRFLGWALDSKATKAAYLPGSTFKTMDRETTLYAVWGELPSIEFKTSGSPSALTGGEISLTVSTVPSNATVTATGADWLTFADGKITGTAPSTIGDYQMVLKAKAGGYADTTYTVTITVLTPENSLLVSLNANGGTLADPYRFVLDGGKLTEPEDPERDGFAFLGWYTQTGELYDFGTPVTGNLVLVAHWSQETEKKDDGGSPVGLAIAAIFGVAIAAVVLRRII